MNTETLAALLTDQALDELTPEVGELLDAFLARDPASAAEAQVVFSAVRHAREATRAGEPRTMRPFPLARMQAESDSRRRSVRWVRAMQLAACLAIGVALGSVIRPDPARSGEGPPGTVAVVAPAESSDSAPSRQGVGGGFWSQSRFLKERRESAPPREARHRAEQVSPFSLPRVLKEVP